MCTMNLLLNYDRIYMHEGFSSSLGTKKNVFFWKETKQFFSFIFFVVPVFWRQTKHKTGTENRFLYPFSGTAKMKNTKKSVIFSFLGRPYLGQFLVSKKKTWCVRNLFTQSMQKLHFGKNGDGSVPRPGTTKTLHIRTIDRS